VLGKRVRATRTVAINKHGVLIATALLYVGTDFRQDLGVCCASTSTIGV